MISPAAKAGPGAGIAPKCLGLRCDPEEGEAQHVQIQESTSRNSAARIQRAAERNAISVDTVRRLIARGDLKAYRLGERIIRVDLAEVDALFRPIPTVRGRR